MISSWSTMTTPKTTACTCPASSSEPLPRAWSWLALAAMAGIPLVDLGINRLNFSFLPKRALNLTIFDPLIWIAALWLIIANMRRKADSGCGLCALARRWLACVWPALPLLACALVSLTQIEQFDTKAVKLISKNIIQWSEYLLITPLVLMHLLSEAKWRNRAFWALSMTTLLAIAAISWRSPLAAVFAGKAHPYTVGGLLGNRNTYGIFMAAALPVIAGWAFSRSTDTKKIWLILPGVMLPLIAGYTCLAAGALVAMCAGLALTYAARNPAGILFPVILTGILLVADGPENRPLRMRELSRSIQLFRVQTRPGQLMPRSAPTMRAYRWAANLNMIAAHPVLGVGWGQYQRNIVKYYGDLDHPEGTTDVIQHFDLTANEPFTFSWFFVTAGETGLPGLACIMVLLAGIGARAMGLAGKKPCFAAAGSMGAIIGLLMAGLWTSPMVRGAGPLLGLLLAISVAGEEQNEALPAHS